jgi:hypothetical protein
MILRGKSGFGPSANFLAHAKKSLVIWEMQTIPTLNLDYPAAEVDVIVAHYRNDLWPHQSSVPECQHHETGSMIEWIAPRALRSDLTKFQYRRPIASHCNPRKA